MDTNLKPHQLLFKQKVFWSCQKQGLSSSLLVVNDKVGCTGHYKPPATLRKELCLNNIPEPKDPAFPEIDISIFQLGWMPSMTHDHLQLGFLLFTTGKTITTKCITFAYQTSQG